MNYRAVRADNGDATRRDAPLSFRRKQRLSSQTRETCAAAIIYSLAFHYWQPVIAALAPFAAPLIYRRPGILGRYRSCVKAFPINRRLIERTVILSRKRERRKERKKGRKKGGGRQRRLDRCETNDLINFELCSKILRAALGRARVHPVARNELSIYVQRKYVHCT